MTDPKIDDTLIEKVDQLMTALLRPSFVFTMARGMNRPENTTGQQKSARTRQQNAAVQIDDIVQRYVTGGLL